MNSTRQRIISFILILSFLTALTVVPPILAKEIEEDTYERVAGTGLFDFKSLSATDSIYTTQKQTSPLSVEITYPIDEVYTGDWNEAKVGGTISRALKEGEEHIWVALGLPGQWYPQENGPIVPSGLDWETIVYIAGQPMGTKIEVAALIVDDTQNSKLKNYIQDQGEWYEPYENNSEIEENIKASVTVVFKGHGTTPTPTPTPTSTRPPLKVKITYPIDEVYTGDWNEAKVGGTISRALKEGEEYMWVALGLPGQWYPQENGPIVPSGLDWETIVYIAGQPMGTKIEVATLIVDDTQNSKLKNYIHDQGEWYEPYENNSEIEENIKASVTVVFKGHKLPNKLLTNFEDYYVDIGFDTKNMTAKKTTETSYSEPYSMNITYTKLPCEESWNQSFGFGLPISLRDISTYSAISMRVYGSCSISACLDTGDSEGCVYLGTRSSTEPDIWNQLVWDLHAHDVNLSNATGITFLLEDEIGVTRTFFLDDIELTTMDVPKSEVLTNFEDYYVDIGFGTKNMTAKKTTEISYSEPYSRNITYTKLPCEESWNQSFGFELPISLRDISTYSAISMRVYGSCSISACLDTGDSEGCVYLGTRSSTEPDTWKQLVWDLHAHDVNLSNATCMTFLLEDETGVTRTFFLDDIELTTTQPPKILAHAPASPVSDLEGSKRKFILTLDQIANVSWLINGIEIFSQTEVTESAYTNTSAAVGTWKVSAVVSNPNGATVQTWDWIVTKPVFCVKLSANIDALSTAPSENAIYQLTISNIGTVADTYTVSVENPDNADVAALSTYYITNLAAGASTTVLLNVTDAMDGLYRIRVKATSEGDTTKSATINTMTTVDDTTPPACIINLKNTTYASTYINWTWNDPADADLLHVMVYLNGSFQINVSKGTQFYNATELTPDTAYTIGIRTVDTSGNINQTWVNLTVSLSSNNIYVPDDYPTIQAAVDVASPGNTIIVRNGMYTENVDVNKRLTIHSENGAGASIVHAANPKDHVFGVTANYVNISGFTVKGATDWVAGIYLENVDHCCVINNYISNNYNGITLKNSSGNRVSNNNVNSNELRGIDVEYSSNNNIIKNNSVSSNMYGIDIRTSCNNNIITDNDVNSNTKAGIALINSCNNNVITNNTACHNYDRGIEISSSSNNIISGNIASFNEHYGILLDRSSSNNIANNTANSNSNGISLRDSSNNYIYLNNLKSNDYNVHLYNSNNIWKSPSQITYIYNGRAYTNYLGNYWGDYKEKYLDAEEIGGCGIWDTPHKIDSDNSDKYPLIDEFEIYRVDPQRGIVTIGYAIIIAGGKNDPIQPYFDLTTNNIYKKLLTHGFTHKRIFYLNPSIEQDADGDGIYDVDKISSLTNISYAINTWAQGNVSATDALLIYMVDHGEENTFFVNDIDNTLTATDLNNHLDNFTDVTGCYDIVVVYDACSSGSFINELSRAGRIIITSTNINVRAIFDKTGGLFSYFFFNNISAGKTIKEAFEDASNSPDIKQYKPYNITPLLDDNGDGVGHAIPLSGTGDGSLAASKHIGILYGAPISPPTITDVIPSQKVVVNTTITIWSVVDADSSIKDVYASIFEPNFNISSANDTLINPTILYLEDPDGDDNYTASFTPTELGDYTLILHATDDEGYMASPKQCIITAVLPPESAIFDTGGVTRWEEK